MTAADGRYVAFLDGGADIENLEVARAAKTINYFDTESISLRDKPYQQHGPLALASEFLEGMFSVSQRGSSVEREIRAGLVTWVTMSYIVVVNPMILSAPTSDGTVPISFHAACRATCLSAAVASAFVGIVANLPFGLAAGMGLNSYLRYGVITKLGLSAGGGLAACFVQGVIFAALTALGVADRVQDMLPASLKSAITVAIGVFQAFIGFQLMGLVVQSESTLVGLGDISRPALWLAGTSTLLVAALLIRKTKGALLIGIAFTTMAWNLLDLPNTNEGTGVTSSEIDTPMAFRLDFGAAFENPQAFFTAVLSMLFVVIFDTAGVQHGIGQQAGLLDECGRLPGAKHSYYASALGTILGSILGTSPVIIHNETAAGVQEGARTGLAAVTTAILFLLSPMLVPLIELIPQEATAPCLVLVGTMMMTPIRDVDFSDLRIALPSFLIISVTPLTYSISAGIFTGMASYVILSAVLRLSDLASNVGDDLGRWGAKSHAHIDEKTMVSLPILPPPAWAPSDISVE